MAAASSSVHGTSSCASGTTSTAALPAYSDTSAQEAAAGQAGGARG
jgi:hypothetical protein